MRSRARWRSLPGPAPELEQRWLVALATLGASIYLIGRRLDKLEAVAAKARETGAAAACYSADLSSSSDLHEVALSHQD